MSKNAVIYARYSTDMQREASIDAQIRSCTEYAQRQGYHVVEVYADRAVSGKSAKKRVEFKRMISDAKCGSFDVIIVDKIDRFARSLKDTVIYVPKLYDLNVELQSVHEALDYNTPQGRFCLYTFGTMAQFYSDNLATEVQKGMRENAYKGIHTGGIPPLGYDVDPNTKKLAVNECEASAVRLIFKRAVEGCSYEEIAAELSNLGYRTKRNESFGKNSLNSILQNEKYVGVYVFNKAAKATSDGKRNGHKYKDEGEIIRIKDGCPAIVTREEFDMVQQMMASRKRRSGAFTAKQTYLLSGKIRCGVCGGAFNGNSKRPRPDHPLQVEYRCNKNNGKAKCNNKAISRDLIEGIVLKELADRLFNDELLGRIIDEYNAWKAQRKSENAIRQKGIENSIKEIDAEIERIIAFMLKLDSVSLGDKLHKLEQQKAELQSALKSIGVLQDEQENAESIRCAFQIAKEQLKDGGMKNARQLITQFVDRIEIFPNQVDIYFAYGIISMVSNTKKNQPSTLQSRTDSFSKVAYGDHVGGGGGI